MRALLMHGFVQRLYVPLTSEQTKVATRPSAVWMFPPKQQKKLEIFLDSAGRSSEWQEIEDELFSFREDNQTVRKNQRFAEQSLRHEIGITDVSMALDCAVEKNKGFELLFFIRTSPRHPVVSKKIEVTRARRMTSKKTGEQKENKTTFKQTMNPDFFSCVKCPDGLHVFTFGEFDNDTSNEAKFLEKLEGYIAYEKQKHFGELCKTVCRHFGIAPEDLKGRTSLRVLTVVASASNAEKRLRNLYMQGVKLPTERFLNFTTLADFQRESFGNIILNKKMFEPVKDEYLGSTRHHSVKRQREWFSSVLPNLLRDSIVL